MEFTPTESSAGLFRGFFSPWSLHCVLSHSCLKQTKWTCCLRRAPLRLQPCLPTETQLQTQPHAKPTKPLFCFFTVDKRNTIQNQEVNVPLRWRRSMISPPVLPVPPLPKPNAKSEKAPLDFTMMKDAAGKCQKLMDRSEGC